MLQRENKRARRIAHNADSSFEAAANEISFHADDIADGSISEMRASDDAVLDSYISTLLSDMGNEMFRSEDAAVQEVDVPEYKYTNRTNKTRNQVCACVFCLLLVPE